MMPTSIFNLKITWKLDVSEVFKEHYEAPTT
jgi:hypothetical protein